MTRLSLTSFVSLISQGQGAKSKARQHFAKTKLESVGLQNRPQQVRIWHVAAPDSVLWACHSETKLIDFVCFSGQLWKNASDGNSPLRNSWPANVSRMFAPCAVVLMRRRKPDAFMSATHTCVITFALFPQMDCVPSPPSWCPSSARRTLRSILPVRITEIPNPPRSCRPKPRRFSTNSSAAMPRER